MSILTLIDLIPFMQLVEVTYRLDRPTVLFDNAYPARSTLVPRLESEVSCQPAHLSVHISGDSPFKHSLRGLHTIRRLYYIIIFISVTVRRIYYL